MARLLISHSEADSFTQCERKWGYAHKLSLQPKKLSEGLSRGNAGHAYLEAWAKGMIAGLSSEEAQVHALNAAAGMPNAAQALALATEWVRDIFPKLGWKIVSVENQYRVGLEEDLVYPFKFDLLVEIRGVLVLVDHKFLYDFYSQQMVDIFPQMPKYIFGLRAQGLNVEYAIYNMFRTRKVNKIEDRYCQRETHPNEYRLRESMKEQLMNMRKIRDAKNDPNFYPVRTANKMTCGNCSFADLCEFEARGESTKLMKEAFFEPNTYGYEDD